MKKYIGNYLCVLFIFTFFPRGVTIYEKGYIQEATLYLKQAEQLAEQLDCELLRNKIYDSLEMINDNAGLFEEAIKYGQKINFKKTYEK